MMYVQKSKPKLVISYKYDAFEYFSIRHAKKRAKR